MTDLLVVGNSSNPMQLAAQSDIKVGLADIVTVAVAKAEEKIREELKAAIANGKALDKEYRDATDELNAAVKAQIHDMFGEEAKAAERFLDQFDTFQFKFEGCVTKDHDTSSYTLKVACRSGWWNYNKTKEVSPNDRCIAAYDACEALGKKIEEANGVAAEWRRKLQGVPTLERRYRGMVVASQLETTEDGKRLLEGLTADIQGAVDSL